MALIRLSKNALFHNLSILKAKAGRAQVAAVLKDNAYGHGLSETATLCAQADVRWAVVRTLEEARRICALFEHILVLADHPAGDLPANVHFALNDAIHVKQWPSGTKVHLKVDSGMHRSGISPADLGAVLAAIADRDLELTGVFSHLKSADELSTELGWQERNFAQIRAGVENFCRERRLENPLFHLYNSAATLRQQSADGYDLVRPGIALYGYCDLGAPFDAHTLKPVLSLWADRLSTRTVAAGERIGYGGVFEAQKPLIASAYDIGYGDGFLRLNGSEGYVTPEGKRLLGRVSMDNVVIEGDAEQICLMDNADILAKLRGTISYEALVRLNPALPRKID